MALHHLAGGNIVPLYTAPQPTAYDPALPSDQRRDALLAALPVSLQSILTNGVARRACFDSTNGFIDTKEIWAPPAVIEPADVNAASRALAEIEREILAPVDPGWLLARLLALFSHCPPRSVPLDPAVEEMVARDWAEDLSEYPRWAIDQAVRSWRRTKKWRPTIVEMRALCEEMVSAERTLATRLRRIAASPTATERQHEMRTMVAGAVRRMG